MSLAHAPSFPLLQLISGAYPFSSCKKITWRFFKNKLLFNYLNLLNLTISRSLVVFLIKIVNSPLFKELKVLSLSSTKREKTWN
jgi:hypothetical protein